MKRQKEKKILSAGHVEIGRNDGNFCQRSVTRSFRRQRTLRGGFERGCDPEKFASFEQRSQLFGPGPLQHVGGGSGAAEPIPQRSYARRTPRPLSRGDRR